MSLRRLRRELACLIAIAVIVALRTTLAAQAPQSPAAPVAPSGTSELGGLVTTGERAQPVRGALVRITATSLRGFREMPTDDAGRFHFTGLPAGRYTLTSRKTGFVEATYGATRRRGLGTAISLADGQRELTVRFPMMRGAVIGGTLTSPSGQPAYSVVQVFERTMVGGQITLTSAGLVVTDERGVFRLFDLAPGTYVVGVLTRGGQVAAPVTSAAGLEWAARQQGSTSTVTAPSPAPTMTIGHTFYPGVREVSAAAPIEVAAGAERLNVDFSLRLVPASRLSGVVSMPDGRPAAGAGVRLESLERVGGTAAALVTPRLAATANERGEFELTAVEPGQFVLIANATTATRAQVIQADRVDVPALDVWAREAVSLDGRDVSGLVVRLQPKVALTGRVIAEAGADPVDLAAARVTISLQPRDGAGSPGVGGSATSVTAGSFAYRAVTPWSYTVSVTVSSGPAGPGAVPRWMVSGATLGGRDVFDKYFEVGPQNVGEEFLIILTNKPPSIAGRLTDERGRPTPDYFVVLVPVDRAYWIAGISRTPRGVRPGNDGAFRFDTVAPGEYYLAASTDFDPREATDSALLEALIERSVRVTVAAGQAAVQDLKIGG